MSKAFTSEETPDAAPLLRPPPRLAPGEVRWVTPEGQAELRGLLARLRAASDPRAAQVEETLAVLTVLGPEATPEGQVGFGCRVSAHSPVGRALIGAVAGDVVEVARPGGCRELKIASIGRQSP